MNQYTKVIVAVVIAAVVLLYGGYRLYNHFTRTQLPVTQVVVTPTKSPEITPVAQNGVYKMMSDSKGVSYLTDEKGMTLYTDSKDTKGVSNCSGTCITNWPAYGPKTEPAASTLPANVTVITRSDKTLQYAWKGMPLYYFASDKKAGEVTGDGVGNFLLAK
jgi:predicted lipoprotein with Yx(FWY)xxD motif